MNLEETLNCALDELDKYRQTYGSVDAIKTKPTPTDQDIKYAEKKLKISFPKSYILFLRQAGACPLIFDEVFWVGSEGETYRDIVRSKEEEKDEECFQDFLIPFYADGYGNYVCFDTREDKGGEYLIVFWDHELQLSEPSEDDLEVVANNFAAWFLEEVRYQINEDQHVGNDNE
ncbi:MAG: cell wall assembly regulator SMI1 [Desulforhopalus sp.]|jgi:cell wall assembly regulator SMI1